MNYYGSMKKHFFKNQIWSNLVTVLLSA